MDKLLPPIFKEIIDKLPPEVKIFIIVFLIIAAFYAWNREDRIKYWKERYEVEKARNTDLDKQNEKLQQNVKPYDELEERAEKVRRTEQELRAKEQSLADIAVKIENFIKKIKSLIDSIFNKQHKESQEVKEVTEALSQILKTLQEYQAALTFPERAIPNPEEAAQKALEFIDNQNNVKQAHNSSPAAQTEIPQNH